MEGEKGGNVVFFREFSRSEPDQGCSSPYPISLDVQLWAGWEVAPRRVPSCGVPVGAACVCVCVQGVDML